MQSSAKTPQEYVAQLPPDRVEAINKLRAIISQNIDKNFVEQMSYGMIGYVVPHTIYPKGYHCSPQLPLPFMNIASQKNSINIYNMGIYADANLYNWFVAEYSKHSSKKLDMGKSCMRFKKPEDIPYQLIGELASKISVQKWVEIYENEFIKK